MFHVGEITACLCNADEDYAKKVIDGRPVSRTAVASVQLAVDWRSTTQSVPPSLIRRQSSGMLRRHERGVV